MSSGKRKLKRGAKKRLFRRFMTIMLSTFVAGTIIVLAGLGAYQRLFGDNDFFQGFTKLSKEEKEKKEKEKKEKLKTNVAVFGVDIDGYRTDTIFIVHFDGEKNKADLVSIPRDTQVKFNDTDYEKIKQKNRYTPRTIKLNEMTAYAGIDNVKEYTVKYLEKMLGIKIDNYITVEIDAFRKIVDAIGGVEVDVPQRMKYSDNSQGLYIDLQPGIQPLDGAAAEGLVRFRKGYAEGDTGRIKTQQIFLKAFAKKLLSPENIPNLPKIIPTLFQHVKTDINVLDLPKYYGYASSFNPEMVDMHTIPGEGLYIGNVSYYIPDMDALDEFIQKIFYSAPEMESDEIIEDKSVKIEVLNGGASAGTANSTKELLEKDGYKVTNIGNYTGNYKEETRIYAKDKVKADQFKKYFNNCQVLENDSLDKGIDIQIVIGSNGA